jgi:hypothetical protein
MNMNNWLPLFVLFADGGKRNQAGAVEAMLTSSNQIPEAPRTLLAVTQARDQADREEQQQKAVTKREEDLAKLIVDVVENKLTVPVPDEVGAALLGDVRIQFMLGKLSDQTLKTKFIGVLGGTVSRGGGGGARPGGRGSGGSRLPTGKP